MNINDVNPNDVSVTGFRGPDTTVRYKDGYYDVDSSGKMHETWQSARDRKNRMRAEMADMQQDNRPAGPDLWEQTLDKTINASKDTFNETNKEFVKGAATVGIIGLLLAFVGGAGSHLSKNEDDYGGAIKKGFRNVACLLGIIGVLLALVICALIAIDFVGANNKTGATIVGIIIVAGYATIFGLIRVMIGRTFFIHPKLSKPSMPDIKKVRYSTGIYILVILISTIAFGVLALAIANQLSIIYMDYLLATYSETVLVMGVPATFILGAIVGFIIGHLLNKILHIKKNVKKKTR